MDQDLRQDLTSLSNRIAKAKVRMLVEHPFYGLLVQRVNFAIDLNCETACTDGKTIYFGRDFSTQIDNDQLYFVLMHELLHIVLGHCFRAKDLDNFMYNIAADIVINSIIMDEFKVDDFYILDEPAMHKTPDNKDGRFYTAEEVYAMLATNPERSMEKLSKNNKNSTKDGNGKQGGGESQNENENGNNGGSLYKEINSLEDKSSSSTAQSKGQSNQNNDSSSSSSTSSKSDKNGNGSTSSTNSKDNKNNGKNEENNVDNKSKNPFPDYFFDDHSHWGTLEDNELNKNVWKQQVYEVYKELENANLAGNVPVLIKRMVDEIIHPTIDWKSVLINFIQQEVNDYSFSPPDKRFSDGMFLLPDFNETEDKIENVFVAIDTSGSVSSKQVSMAINEIKGAIDQFNGRFKGWLSCFDFFTTEPKEFESFDDVKKIEIKGGGGTSFINVIKTANEFFKGDIMCIIIITDGVATYPNESDTLGVPVLWLLNNKRVNPPWGKVARMLD